MSDEQDWFTRARETTDRLRAFEEAASSSLPPKPVKRVASTMHTSTSPAKSMNNRNAYHRIQAKRQGGKP